METNAGTMRGLHRLLPVLAVLLAGCGAKAEDSSPSNRGTSAVPATTGDERVVELHRNAPVRATVVVDGDRRLRVAVESVADSPRDSGSITPAVEVRVDLESNGRTTSHVLTADESGRRFVHEGELPAAIRTADDLAGTLIVIVDDVEYRGRFDERLADVTRVRRPPAPASAAWNRAIIVLVVYGLLIVAASLVGGWLPSLVDLTHDRMQVAMSLVGGLMLGIGLFHMLPHGVHEIGSVDRGVWWMMIGLVSMFLLIRTFHFHQHGPVAHPVEGPVTVEPLIIAPRAHRDHDHDHDHDHDAPHDHPHVHDHSHGHGHEGPHELSWLGVFIGLSLHTLIDGVALAASVRADVRGGNAGWLLGVGTFLAIVLHKPLDAVSITTLMSAGGWSPSSRNLANLAYASMCPLGALAFAIGLGQFGGGAGHLVVGAALSFSAGVFVCISLGDILPEMEFHDHNRVTLTLVLLTGIALAWAIGFLEPSHAHPPI